MKILLFSSVYPPRIGGPSTQTRQLARLLLKNGYRPVVATWGTQDLRSHDEGIPVHTINSYDAVRYGPVAQYTRLLPRLLQVVRAERPDILYYATGCDYGCGIAGLAARALRLPRVVKFAGDLVWEVMSARGLTEHAYPAIHRSSPRARALAIWQHLSLRQYQLVWATSEFQGRVLCEVVRLPPYRIHRMPNYVSVYPTQRPAHANAPVTFLSVGRFAPWKRVEDVVGAFTRIARPDVRLRLVGGENSAVMEKLRVLASELGVAPLIEFVGAVSPVVVKEEFQRADVFVMASVYEPFGIALVEAMEAGLPAIATTVGGIPEIVVDGVTGVLVPPRRENVLAEAMRQLADDADLRQRMGSAARRRALDFSLEEHLGEVLAFFAVAQKGR